MVGKGRNSLSPEEISSLFDVASRLRGDHMSSALFKHCIHKPDQEHNKACSQPGRSRPRSARRIPPATLIPWQSLFDACVPGPQICSSTRYARSSSDPSRRNQQDARPPPGLVDHGNACFIGSVPQGVCPVAVANPVLSTSTPVILYSWPFPRNFTTLFISTTLPTWKPRARGSPSQSDRRRCPLEMIRNREIGTPGASSSAHQIPNGLSRGILATPSRHHGQDFASRQQVSLRLLLDAMRVGGRDVRVPPMPLQ
jgi:hypothetical protein